MTSTTDGIPSLLLSSIDNCRARLVQIISHSNLCSAPLISARWRFNILLFCVNILLFMHRVNLSLAVICMTKDPTDVVVSLSENVTSDVSIAVDVTTPLVISEGGISPLSGDNTNVTERSATQTLDTVVGSGSTAGVNHLISVATEIVTVPTKRDKTWFVDDQCALTSFGNRKDKGWEAELSWDKTGVSFLLSSYFYGSFFSNVPGGRLADRFGGKHIITAAMVLTSVCSLLTPLCARSSIYLTFVMRILIGMAGVNQSTAQRQAKPK